MNRYVLIALIAVSSVAIKAQGPNGPWYAKERAAQALRTAQGNAQAGLDWAGEQMSGAKEWAGSRLGEGRQWARETLPSAEGLQEKGRQGLRWAGQKAGQAREWGRNVAAPAMAESATTAQQKAGEMWQYGKQWARQHLPYNPVAEPIEPAK